MAHNQETYAWYIDSRPSTHLTSKDELFNIINDTYYGRIIFGDDSVLKVKGKGIVAIVALHVENNLIHGKLSTSTLRKNILYMG